MDWALIALAIVVVIFGAMAVKIVNQYERGLIERWGKYQRLVEPGIQFIVPFMESIKKVDMREQVMDVPPQEVITKDNVVVTVDAVIYYEVTDPIKVTYNVAQFMLASIKLAQTNLRNIIGDMELDQTLTSRERINANLKAVLDQATDVWGIRITRVEIQKIDPPVDITEAMHRQMKAERLKRATILDAEGARQAEINKAEGDRQAKILRAEGEAIAIKTVADAKRYESIAIAEGQQQAIINVFNGIHDGKVDDKVLSIKYLEAFRDGIQNNSKIVVLPLEFTELIKGIKNLGGTGKVLEEGLRKIGGAGK
jgi:regulator of protease activity HflC (stomatin/prohibitin superfamily)